MAKEKTYAFTFLDKDNNTLQRKVYKGLFNDIYEAKSYARNLQAVSMLNDLHAIKVKKV